MKARWLGSKSVTQARGSVRTTRSGLMPMMSPGPVRAKLFSIGAPVAATETTIDGVHLFGLYRNHENPKGNQVVTEFFEDLKKNSKFFQFDDKIEFAQYVKTASPDEGTWASTFEMRLPLKRRITLPVDTKRPSSK